MESARVDSRFDLAPLEQGGPLPLALVRLELDHVGGVGALELVEAAVGEVEDLVDRPVKQLEVVGHHQDGAGEALELLHQPSLGREVEVVGRLVEDHGVRTLEQDADQVDPAALPPERPSMSSNRSSWGRPSPSARRAMVDSAS